METLTVTTLDGGEVGLERSEVEGLADRLRGELILPEDPGYDEAREVWNGMIDKRPALIARPAGTEDVVEAVSFARERDLLVAVRGGGHNVAGKALCDGGLVVDLSGMKEIRVDPDRRTARAGGGAIWRDLDRETQAHGLATPGGFISTTGIGGLTLGGGISWLMGSHGLSCDNLLSAEVVTADGRVVTASPEENEDLFWGLRGGGGNFGVVTSFEFRLHPVGPEVLGGQIAWPLERAREVYELYRELTLSAPDELIAIGALLPTPDGTPAAAVAVCYNGPIEEGEEAVRPLRELSDPLVDEIGRVPFVELQRLFDDFYPPGPRAYWKSGFLSSLTDEAIDTMIEHFAKRPSPLCHSFLEGFSGAVRRVGPTETAFAQRDADFNFTIIALWTDPAEDEAHVRWARDYWDAMRPFTADGVYVNYLGEVADEGEERVRAAYGPNYERLVEVKAKYDPENFFRVNQNIEPSAATA